MKKWLSALIIILILVPVALADTVADLVPDTSLWGISRTKFKEQNGRGLQEIEVGDYKCIVVPDFEVNGYTMDCYLEFGESMGNYYGLSRVIYILDVSKKASDSELKTCYNSFVQEVLQYADPSEQTKTSSTWFFDNCTIEIGISTMRDFNGSKNKTVYISFLKPEEIAGTVNGTNANRFKSKTMSISASASCNDYNHVGNEWVQRFYVNGEEVWSDSVITLNAGDTITVEAEISEHDKNPDTGTETVNYIVTEQDLTRGFTISFNVSVTENGGRYSGNTAKWSVVFRFS